MKQFACGDVVSGCGRVFRAPDDDRILAEVAVHARDDHGMITLPDALVERVRSKISVVA